MRIVTNPHPAPASPLTGARGIHIPETLSDHYENSRTGNANFAERLRGRSVQTITAPHRSGSLRDAMSKNASSASFATEQRHHEKCDCGQHEACSICEIDYLLCEAFTLPRPEEQSCE